MLSVFHMFYFVLIVTGTMSHDPINNLGQRLNIKQVIVPADFLCNESRSKKKVIWLIIASTTFTGIDACADPEFFSRGSEGYFSFRGMESEAYFR